MIGTHTDITKIKMLEKHLIEAKDAAETANNVKSAFLSNMSHELRTPLTPIVGFTKFLLDSEEDEKRKKFLQTILTSSNRMTNLVNSVLDFSKIEAEHLSENKSIFNIHEILLAIKNEFETRIKTDEVKLHLEINEDIPLILNGDNEKFKTILHGLFSNATKFTKEGHCNYMITIFYNIYCLVFNF